ncbi:MAG: hypothetical protein R2688_08255 [Fimbriimonadaceae bacterium]
MVTVVRDIDSVRIDMYLLGANMQTMSSASRTLQLGGTGSSNHAFNQPFFKFDEYGTAAKQVAAAFVQGRFAGQRNTWGKDTVDKARTNDPAMLPFVGGIDPGARSILLGQTKLDPVATLVDYAFAGQMTTDNYVIAFPDHMASELAWDASRDNLNSTAKTWDEVTFKKEGDWSVMGLADPISAWSTRVPRGTLYALEQKVSRQYGLVSLSDKASYARAAGRGIGTDNWDTGAMSWLFGTSAGQEIRDVHGNDYFPLMIYGALSADQRQQGASGAGLTWAQISGIYPLLTDWYYNGRRDPNFVQRVATPSGATSGPGGRIELALVIETAQQQGMTQGIEPRFLSQIPVVNISNMERTELLPSGMGNSTLLQFTMSTRDGFVALNSQNGESQIFDARSYARNKANAAYNPRGAGVNDPSFFKQFLNTSNISINATLVPYEQVRLSEGADGVEAQGGFGSYDALKGSTRAQIDRYYADYENAYLRNSGREQTIRRGGRGGGTPPPAQ